jgi:hypothetical protein
MNMGEASTISRFRLPTAYQKSQNLDDALTAPSGEAGWRSPRLSYAGADQGLRFRRLWQILGVVAKSRSRFSLIGFR